MKILLRKATLADAKPIANVYLTSRKTFLPFAPLMHADEDVYRWVRETLIPTNQVVVATENDAIVGMMAVSKNQGVGWIDQLYLAPEAVGRGIGSLLIENAKSTLESPICLHTFQENMAARRFYEKHGFSILSLGDGSANEENCPDVVYEWRVRS